MKNITASRGSEDPTVSQSMAFLALRDCQPIRGRSRSQLTNQRPGVSHDMMIHSIDPSFLETNRISKLQTIDISYVTEGLISTIEDTFWKVER